MRRMDLSKKINRITNMINEEIQLGKKFTINSILDIVKIEVKLPIVEKNKFNDCIEIKFVDDELQAKEKCKR